MVPEQPERQAGHGLSNKGMISGTTALVALHDVHLLGHVDASRTRVIGLREGKIVWQGQLDHDQFGQGLEQIHGVPFHRMESAGNEFWLPAMEEDLS